jgi:A/G-specific adenine glycosylase
VEAQAFKHVLTHKDLHLHPVFLTLPKAVKLDALKQDGRWVSAVDWPVLGLPAPVRQLLSR